MSFQTRSIALLAVIAAFCCGPVSGAGAATSGSFDDPIGDMLEFAPDLGATSVTVGDDETVSVDTRIVPRPPAGWGGCAYYVVGICMPADMTVTWYLDHTPGSGSVADGGADAKVIVIPRRGQTFWEGSRWDTANGKFSAGAEPAAAEDSGGVRWTLRLADLGIPKPATVRIWVVSLYKSYNGLGQLFNYEDKAGPGTVAVDGPPPVTASLPCKRKAAAVNRIQRRLRGLRRGAAQGKPGAQRKLRRLRATRARAVRAMKRSCGPPATGAPAPTTAPPGCKLVTKPVLQQEGIGIHAEWVVKPEVVVECSK